MTYYLHKPTRRHRLRQRCAAVVALASLIVMPISFVPAFAANAPAIEQPPTPPLLINEIKTGGTNTTPSEYVILYNRSDATVILDGWTLEYAKPTFPSAQCNSTNWKAAGGSAVNSLTLSGSLEPRSGSNMVELAMNNDVAGSVRLVDKTGIVNDVVGWGSAVSAAPCKEATQAPMLNSNKSLVRYLDCLASDPIDSDDNLADFMLTSTPKPGELNAMQAPQCTPPETTEPPVNTTPSTPAPTPTPTPTVPVCQNVVISELLANPAGTDTGHEYIELHNLATSANDLAGCNLQTSASNTSYSLVGIILAPGEYRAITDDISKLSLPNASGGTAWLLSSSDELQTVTYPADMDDDVAWTLADGLWGASYTPTIGAANLLTAVKPCPAGQDRNLDTNRCVTIGSDTEEDPGLTPCEAGKERNPETNRCRTIAVESNTVACPAGQVRNPGTNRCRSAASTGAATLTECKPGQERNPETNRCRAAASATDTAKACPTGQERNPETNRCRKIVAAGSGQSGSGGQAKIEDVTSSGHSAGKPYWLIAAGVLVAATAYGVYEWRQEIRFLLKKAERQQATSSPSRASVTA